MCAVWQLFLPGGRGLRLQGSEIWKAAATIVGNRALAQTFLLVLFAEETAAKYALVQEQGVKRENTTCAIGVFTVTWPRMEMAS